MNRSIAAVATLWLALAGGAWGQGVPNGGSSLVPNQAPACSLSGCTLTGGLSIRDGTPLISSGVMTQMLNIINTATLNGTVGGTSTAYANAITCQNDTAAAAASLNGALYCLELGHIFGGSAVTGARQAFAATLQMNATTGNVGAGNLSEFYNAAGFYSSASANDGGTNIAYASSVYGINPQASILSGATYYRNVAAAEFNVGVMETIGPPLRKYGITIVQLAADAAQGTQIDSALNFSAQQSASYPGWSNIIGLGTNSGYWPCSSTCTIFGTFAGLAGTPAYQAAYGIDFNAVTFSSGFLRSSGYLVDGSGNETVLTEKITAPGTLTNPALVFSNCGTNCGISAPASGQIEIITAGSSKIDFGVTTANRITLSSNTNFGGVIQLGSGGQLLLDGGLTSITSTVANLVTIGGFDAASPSAFTVGTQNVVAGNGNTPAADFTIRGGLSNGNGASDLIFRTTQSIAGSGVQNNPATALTLKGGTQQAIFAGQITVTSMTQTAVAQSGTVCYNSGTGAITYDATLGCLASTLQAKNDWLDMVPEQALAIVKQLRPGTYTYKLGLGLPDGPQVGFAAEQVAEIDPRLVGYRPDGTLGGVRYQQASALYAGAITALETRLEALEARVH